MEQHQRTHPIVIAAATAVLVSSALAAAVLTGILPSASSKSVESEFQSYRASAAEAKLDSHAHSAKLNAARAATSARAATCNNCGVIESVEAVEAAGQSSGLGAVAGGVTGAVVGNQFGRGAGRTAMTLLGAAGGALAGNAIEKNTKRQLVYRVSVRMDDGSHRTLTQSAPPAHGVGERVRVVNGSSLEQA